MTRLVTTAALATSVVFAPPYARLRFALRQLAKAPAFTAVAALTLALGIGLMTALFSVVYGVLLDPYPYVKSNEIWSVQMFDRTTSRGTGYFRVADYLAIAELPGVAKAMATTGEQVTLAGDNPAILNAVLLSGTAFDFLGVPPVVGRTFTAADVKANGEAEPVAILAFQFWQQLFHGDPNVIGLMPAFYVPNEAA